jgi:hypothetical protein
MTQAITPEERAAGLCAAIARGDAAFDKRGWQEMPKADRQRYLDRSAVYEPLIAAAIRDAENATADRIAESMELALPVLTRTRPGEPTRPDVDALMLFQQGLIRQVIETIRSLKHPETA